MKVTWVALAVMAFAASACTTESMRRTVVANRSSLDFRCPARTIRVVRVGSDTYVAVGCEKRATYSLRRCNRQTVPAYCHAVRSTRVRCHAPGAPLPRKYGPSKRRSPLENCCPVLSRAPR